jgi:DNA-binding Xre family transcriptional regulator
MAEQRTCRRQQQVKGIKRLAHETNNRGMHLNGLWSCRIAAGLTQRELAAMIGSHQSTIHALERQNRGAYPKTIKRLCEALEVEPADLLLCEDL